MNDIDYKDEGEPTDGTDSFGSVLVTIFLFGLIIVGFFGIYKLIAEKAM